MSTEITMMAVQKVDCVPFAEFYLGGNGTKRIVEQLYGASIMLTSYGGVVGLSSDVMLEFLMDNQDEFYAGNDSDDAQAFIFNNAIGYAYFICLNM